MSKDALLLDLYRRGLETSDCVGYRGTSIESIATARENTGLPGYSPNALHLDLSNPELPQPYDIYFYPRLKTFPFSQLPLLLEEDRISPDTPEFAYADAHRSAPSLGKAHRLLTLLNLDIGKYSYLGVRLIDDPFGRDIGAKDIYNHLVDKGISRTQVLLADLLSRHRKGVVVGLKEAAINQYPILEGDAGDDFRLNVGPGGLDLHFLSGLKPLGLYEKYYFMKLRINRRK
jgi:hypothetical protein